MKKYSLIECLFPGIDETCFYISEENKRISYVALSLEEALITTFKYNCDLDDSDLITIKEYEFDCVQTFKEDYPELFL